MSRGSFWPSPSMVAMMGLVAGRMAGPQRVAEQRKEFAAGVDEQYVEGMSALLAGLPEHEDGRDLVTPCLGDHGAA